MESLLLSVMKRYVTGTEINRLHHRGFAIDDAESFFALNSTPDEMRFIGEPLIPTLDAAKQAIASYPDFDKFGYGRWPSALKETQTVIGFCGLKYLADLDAVNVGYRFLPQYWGRGLATEACVASLDFGFITLCLDQIIGLVLSDNHASIAVLEKADMKSDGKFVYNGTLVLRYAKR